MFNVITNQALHLCHVVHLLRTQFYSASALLVTFIPKCIKLGITAMDDPRELPVFQRFRYFFRAIIHHLSLIHI